MPVTPPPALESPQTVKEVVVDARRAPASPDLAAYSIVTLDAARLATSDRIDAALTSAPGVSLFRRTSSLGANPTTQGISVRAIAGTGAGRALVTLDGVPQNDPFGGWVIWSALPTGAIGQAEIVRGAGAARDGPAALTGMIALSRTDNDRASASVAGQSDRAVFVQKGVAAPGGRITLDVQQEESDGWVPVRLGRGAVDQALTLSASSASLRYDTQAGDIYVAARLSGFDERRGAGVVYAGSRERGGQASLTVGTNPLASGFGWRAQGWLTGSNLYNTSASVAAGRASATPANRQYDTPATGLGLSVEGQWIDGATTLRSGVDLRAASGESREQFRYLSGAFTRNRVAGGDAETLGLFAEGATRLDGWTLNGAVRVDNWRNTGAHRLETNAATGAQTLNLAAPDRDGAAPTARLGVQHPLADGLTARALVYTGFRPPTLNELHRPFRVGNDVTEANPVLKPERLSGAEAGLNGRIGDGRWTVTAFVNRLADAVTNVTVASGPITDSVAGLIPAGGTLRQRRNVDAVNATGLEASAEIPLTPQLTLDLSAALTRARVEGGSGARALTGLRPAGTPDASATASIVYRPIASLDLAAELRQEGRRFDDDQNLRPLRASTTAALSATWRWRPGVAVFVAGDNLGQRVQTARDASGVLSYGPPTTLRIGLKLGL